MKTQLSIFCLALIFTSCQETSVPEQPVQMSEKLTVTIPSELLEARRAGNGRVNGEVDVKDLLNETLFANANVKVSEVHAYKAFDPSTTVETIDQQFQSTLPTRWVPGDENRNWNGDNDLDDIDWVSFTPFALANGSINAEPIYRAMYNKWENDGFCNTVAIEESPYDLSMGNPSQILNFGLPNFGPYADISVVGFLPSFVFEEILEDENVLGVAFSFVFVDENGDPLKTTRGKEDKAFTEVWFNDGFNWALAPGPGVIDLESVILHEFGHTLNLGHFGILQLFRYENGTVELDYQPVNTMNAFYIGESRNFLGPNDKGNFCEAWGSWPWN